LAAGAVVEGFVLQPDGAPAGAAEVMLAGGDEVVSATAGTSGGFAAEVAAGTYTVTARRGSAAGAWPVLVTVAAGGRARGLVIRLGAAAAIGGVVTAADGAPLPGAAVAVSSPGATGELAHAESDARGRFAVEALAAGTYQVAVAADGWTPASRTGIAVLTGERVELAIALARQGAIEGVVRDGTGRAVAEARVSAGRRTWAGPGAAEAVARTDAAGHFLLRALEAGRNEVAAARDDAGTGVIASVEVAPGSVTSLDLTLPETGRLEGLVIGRDRAPPGRAVVLVRSRGPPPVSARVEVDRDGAYALQLPAGDYDAVAAPAEGARALVRPRPATVRIAPGQASRLDLVLDAAARAAASPAVVQVIEPDGSGSPATLVLVTAGDDLRNAGSAVTDEAGVARVELAEHGSLLVRALRSGRAGGPVPLDTSGPTVVTLRAPARLRGRVVSHDGPPVAGFSFQLAALGDDASVASTIGGPAGTRNARGVQAPLRLEFSGDRFEVADASPGPVRVSVQTPSGGHAHVELELAPGEQRELEVVLEPGASVEGRAVDARTGSPVAGTAVVVERVGSPPRSEATTGADGRFRLTGLPMGARRLRLIAPGYAPAERDADLGAGESLDLGEIALAVGTQASILPRSP
ncbi:MAG TPA: carboxypeptidase-like regulatory domain-containing protein, partial [Anaeromyxobacteraceae bacterium]|nr:carboxypeptidase-like regulatory domain-containing protein [Anaeromyxobacteraceae bacterium]